MRMARAPFGFVSGGVGTITCRSGCRCAATCEQGRHRPQPALVSQSSAWARASAVVVRPLPAGPTKAYAWATRPPSSARRSSATARGLSPIGLKATPVLLHECPDFVRHLVGVTPGPDEPHALGLGAPDLEISAADAAMKGELLALEVIEPSAA